MTQFAVNHAYNLADIIRQRGNAATQNLSALTESSTTVTATLTAHGFVVGQSVLIAGSTPSGYNGQFAITAVTANTFTYTAAAGLTSPATVVGNVTDSVAVNTERCFRCTTAGTSSTTTEPTWTLTSNGTTTSGTAVFTECTGQEAHQRDNGVTTTWTAPAARWNNLSSVGKNVLAVGDTGYLSSDHAETQATANNLAGPGTLLSPNRAISVSKAGSVPPVAADITAGASIAVTNAAAFSISFSALFDGVTITSSSTLTLCNGSNISQVYLNGAFVTTANIGFAVGTNATLLWDNCTVQAGSTSQLLMTAGTGTFEWRNTASAIQGATIPTTLFQTTNSGLMRIRGVDLSGLGSGNLVTIGGNVPCYIQFSNCKLGSGFVITTATGTAPLAPLVETINCDSANTNYNNARSMRGGNVTTDASVTRVGGATDGTTPVSRKLVSGTAANATVEQLVDFPIPSSFLYDNPSAVGVSCTATVEVISSGSLNINDLWLELEYPGSSSSPLSSFGTSAPATPLTSAGAITSSGATWNNPPATPVTQKMQVVFVPHAIGPIYGVVKLGKASATGWIDPTLVISIP